MDITNIQPTRYVATPGGFVVVLRQGDDVFARLAELMRGERIPSASLSGLGFGHATFGFWDAAWMRRDRALDTLHGGAAFETLVDRIAERRATFVAAALAGMSTACGKEPSKNPEPCLSVPIQQPPCLSPVAQPPPDAGPDASETPEDAGAPLPCLSVAAPREDAGAPKPCLKIAPPTTQTARPHPTPLPLPCLTPKRWEDGQK